MNKPHTQYDALIIGAGHNGLTCACYLADAGLKVRIVERRSIVGGAAVTEEFHPGFRNSTASYTVSLLNPKVIDDLGLIENGLKLVERPMSNFYPLGQNPGEYLCLYADGDQTQEEFRRFSTRDANALPHYYDAIESAADILRDLVLETPPNLGGGITDMWRGLKTGNRFRKLALSDQQLLINLFTKSAVEILDRYFEHDAIKAAFAFDGIVGAYASPYTPGTGYVLLHHAFGELNGKKGAWGHAIGGMGAITQTMARVAQKRGVSISVDASVKRLLVDGNKVTGVELDDGEIIYARLIASNANPKHLYTQLTPREALPPAFASQMDNFAAGSGTFRMNVALSGLPKFSALPNINDAPSKHLSSGIIIGPSLNYLDQAYMDARRDGYSSSPIVELLIPSTIDDSLAPAGAHVASLFCQHFAPTLPDGRNWDDERDGAAQKIIETVNRFAPNFSDAIIAQQIHSPLDLERKFGLPHGDIFHGRLSLDQMFSARPALGYADYRGPLKGLYLCGAGAHPGGGVTGAPGHNCAREIIKDFKKI